MFDLQINLNGTAMFYQNNNPKLCANRKLINNAAKQFGGTLDVDKNLINFTSEESLLEFWSSFIDLV